MENWVNAPQWPWHHPASVLRLEPLGGEAEVYAWPCPLREPLRIGADRSGTYRVHVDSPLGYRAPEPFTVELTVGRTLEREVVLQRIGS